MFSRRSQKTIVGQAGDLRYGFGKSLSAGMENFSTVIEFSLAGFQDEKVLRQWIESPGRSHRPHADRPARGDFGTD